MKILINEGLSTLGNLTGIGNVSYNLWKHLNKITDCDLSNYNYLKYLPRIIRRQLYIINVNLETIFNKKYDIIHYQNYYTPKPHRKIIQVTTIHDLSVFKYPQLFPEYYLPYIRRAIIKSLERVEAIVTPSESIKAEILDKFKNIQEQKVNVIFNGVNELYFNQIKNENIFELNQPYINDSFFLFVGTLEQRKNISFLLNTFINAYKSSAISKNTKLILVGKAGFGFNEIEHLIKHPNIVWLRYIQNENLIQLYKTCKALVMPSLYEGFGIPVAEAIVTNTPIIASNIPTNLEFHKRHNNQLFLFDLNNKENLIELLSYIDNNSNLRSNLNYGGTSIYSYTEVVRNHINLYRSILNR